jgi:cytochrome c-type biogenesis protein CcmF
MVVIFIGIMGSAFNADVEKQMQVGQTLNIGPYSVLVQNFDETNTANYDAQRVTLEVFRDGKSAMMLYPERRTYTASQVTETIVAVESSPLRDLYLVYSGVSPDTNQPVIHAYLNPLVKWIWFGGVIVVLGTGLAMLPNRRTGIVLRPVESRLGDAVRGGDVVSPALGTMARSGNAHD